MKFNTSYTEWKIQIHKNFNDRGKTLNGLKQLSS